MKLRATELLLGCAGAAFLLGCAGSHRGGSFGLVPLASNGSSAPAATTSSSAPFFAPPPVPIPAAPVSAPPPAAPVTSAAPAAPRPVVVLSYFTDAELPALLAAVQGVGLVSSAAVVIGTYGVSSAEADRIHATGAEYAPIFTFASSATWTARTVTPADAALLATRPDAAYAGVIPTLHDLLRLPAKERLAWGRELGHRFRDRIRPLIRGGRVVESWQLDEVSPSANDPTWGPAMRELTRATLHGLHDGRAVLGDAPVRGFVHFAHTALRLAAAPADPALLQFWSAVAGTCRNLIGEEYPDFVGSPLAAAGLQSRWQHELAKQTDIRAALATIYVGGFTPGLRLAPSLGGNTGALPASAVNDWRSAFVGARSMDGIAGIGEFNWIKENSDPAVMRDTLSAVAAALPNIR